MIEKVLTDRLKSGDITFTAFHDPYHRTNIGNKVFFARQIELGETFHSVDQRRGTLFDQRYATLPARFFFPLLLSRASPAVALSDLPDMGLQNSR